MDTMSALAYGEANRGLELMVFDWDKAAKIIKERNFEDAYAGLTGDFEWTGGRIFEDGKPVFDDYTYLASTWAIPLILIDGDQIPCFKMESETDGWSSGTKWPKSSLDVLGYEMSEQSND